MTRQKCVRLFMGVSFFVVMANPVVAQSGPFVSCMDSEVQKSLMDFPDLMDEHEITDDRGGMYRGGPSLEKIWIEVDADGLHVDPNFWTALNLTQKKTLMLQADMYHECVVWPAAFDSDPASQTWYCGLMVYEMTAVWDDWTDPPQPIAEIKTDMLPPAGCEFEF